MLFPGQQFLLPVSHNDMISGDWLYIPNSVHNTIKNTILATPQPNTPESEVYLDAQNNKVLIALNNELYAVNLETDHDAIIINNGLAEVSFHNSRAAGEKTRDFEPLSINVTAEECEPFLEWMHTMQNNKDNYNFIPSISPEVKALFASWIQQLGNVPIDMEVASAMIYYGHGDQVLTELNSDPDNYYVELQPDLDMEGYRVENSEDCYPGLMQDTIDGNQVLLYYTNYPEKNEGIVREDLNSLDVSEYRTHCLGGDWTQVINGRTYTFYPVSEAQADAHTVIGARDYQASPRIENDGGQDFIVVGDVSYSMYEPAPVRGAVRTIANGWGIAASEDCESCHEK